LTLRADDSQIWEALRALHRVGGPGEIEEVTRFTKPPYPDRIRQQAGETLESIRKRRR
jgi:hypothetical protein